MDQWINIFNGESDSSGITDSYSGCSRPHNAPTLLQRLTKLKISHWHFDKCFYPIKTLSFVKKILSKRFLYVIFFTHIHLTRCLSSMVNLIAVTTLLLTSGLHCCYQRTFRKKKQIIFMLLESAHNFISYFMCNFHSNRLLFLRVMQENKSGCFSWTQCIFCIAS